MSARPPLDSESGQIREQTAPVTVCGNCLQCRGSVIDYDWFFMPRPAVVEIIEDTGTGSGTFGFFP